MKHPSLNLSEELEVNIVQLLLFYHESAVYYLAKQDDLHENIHQARLCCKRIRSILRLARPGMRKEEYRALNAFYRDNARKLSDLRDLTALIEITEKVNAGMKKTPSLSVFLKRYMNSLKIQRNKVSHSYSFTKAKENALHSFKNKIPEIPEISLPHSSEKTIADGMQRIYRRARKYWKYNRSSIDDHLMHQWRKQIKYLWYQLVVIDPVLPGILSAFALYLQRISKKLGEYHDLVILEKSIRDIRSKKLIAKETKALLLAIQKNKQELAQQSLDLADQLFTLTGERVDKTIHRIMNKNNSG